MSKEIMMMTLILNLVTLLFSAALARGVQSMEPLRSFKISENVTYDCIDIYKQPSLDHPLLKNHTIQMKPSVSISGLKSQVGYNETYETKTKCPNGTVPILRNSKEYNSQTQLFAKKFFHPLTPYQPGAHIAGLRISVGGPFHGVEAAFDGYTLNIQKDQASASQIYVGGELNNLVNFISAGMMINPSQFGDGRLWKYAYWQGRDGKGCYNTACPGFVQVSEKIPIAEPIDLKPGVPAWSHLSIHQDQNTANWWITQLNPGAPNVDIGYWPKELFNLLGNGANTIGVGGTVQGSPSGSSPPMGNGKFPNENRQDSASFEKIKVLDSKYKQGSMSEFFVKELLDSPKCYGEKVKESFITIFQFSYGGPGGNSCGI